MSKVYATFIFLLFMLNCYCSDTTALKKEVVIDGIYKSGEETLYVNSKSGIFYLKRSRPKMQDVALSICYDTIASGVFHKINYNIFKFNNDRNYNQAKYNFNQNHKFSDDTLYFEIILPNESAFTPNRFEYQFKLSCSGEIHSTKNIIKISKKDLRDCDNNTLGFVIQDLSPYCSEGKKCNQRIYFRIFDLLNLAHFNNYFTIALLNFSECYVEKIDVQDELIYYNGRDEIQWRGRRYRRI
jgi:hypothetical protein